MKQRLKWDEMIGGLLFAVSLGLLGVSVFLCFSGDIWYDELFTMGLADQSFGGLIFATARDVHPPLYYMIVKLFLMLFGGQKGSAGQAVIAKLVSVLPFLFCQVYALTKIRRHFGMLSAGLFSFLLLTMPRLADYTVEARMYGYALFFVMAGMLHAYELAAGERRGKKDFVNWAALTLYSLAACYTHYFACVGACMVYLYLLLALWRKDRRKAGGNALLENSSSSNASLSNSSSSNVSLSNANTYLGIAFWLSGLCCALGYLPWLARAAAHQVGAVKESYWIQPLTWRSLGGCVKFIFQPLFFDGALNLALTAGLFLIYGALLFLFFFKRRKSFWREKAEAKEKEEEKGRSGGEVFFVCGCLGVLAGIVLFGFLASFLIRPIFVYRYMLPAMGLFWLAFAFLVPELKEKKVLFFLLLLLLTVEGAGNFRSFYGEEMWKRVQMDRAMEALSQIGREDILVYNFDQAQGVGSYYLDNDSYLWYGSPEELIREMYPENLSLVEGEFSDEAGIERMKELLRGERAVWFLGSGNAREEIIEKWEKAGMEAQEEASVMIERYWFNLYRCKMK